MTAIRILLERAIASEQRGELAAARVLYEQVLAREPEHPGALLKLGLLDQADGRPVAARARLEQALRAAQAKGMATTTVWLAIAGLHEHANEATAARDAYERVLAQSPDQPVANFGIGRLALRAGDARQAAQRFRAVLAVARDDVGLLTALGNALRASGAPVAAVEAFGRAASAANSDAALWSAYGNGCMEAELARISQARSPGTSDTSPAEAADLLVQAMDAFERAAALQPSAVSPRVHLAMAARYACDWSRADAAKRSLAERHAADAAHFACSPMMAVALFDDPIVQRAAIRGYSQASLPPPAAPSIVARRGTRLRVGYLSSDFHDHATAHLAAGLFESHDRARIEAFAYATDHDDRSAMRQRLTQAFEHWNDIRSLDDQAAAQRIAGDALDVLVDLKGHTHGARLPILARRPAPVQLHYLGFPGTLAYDAVDGFVADAITAPAGSEAEFAETLLRLPVCYQVNDARRPLPPAALRGAVGLPENALVLACFNQTYKLTRPFFQAWMETLREQRDAVLWLTVPHALARHNLLAHAQRFGVAPERIVFAPVVPQAEHIARLQCADLALDVLPYGSHTTASDSLWAAVPLLTCVGDTFAGRVGASLCDAVGLPELVTRSLPEYARELNRLGADRPRLEHYRQHLTNGRTSLPLFDTESFTRAFEAMLEQAANGVRRP